MKRTGGVAGGAALVVLAVACGDFGSDDPVVTPPPAEAGAPETSAPDAGTTCDPRGKFVRYDPLRSLTDANATEGHASLSPDELRIYFQRDNAIMTATRASLDAEFGAPTELTELHAYAVNNRVATPSISPDGEHLALSVASKVLPVERYDLAIVDRASGSSAFGDTPILAKAANDPLSTQHSPAYQGDGSRIFFSSNRSHPDGGNPETVFVAATPPNEPVHGAHEVMDGKAGTPLVGFGPVPSFDAKTLYWEKLDEQGVVHLYVGSLSDDGLTVSNVERVQGPSGPFFASEAIGEAVGWASADNCRLYIGIDTTDGKSHLWVASRR